MAKLPPRLGTHYTLNRHLPKQEVPVMKTCRTCKESKRNIFEIFGKKMSGKRDNFVTTDVCKECSGKKRSVTILSKHEAVRKAAEAYNAETLSRIAKNSGK